MQRPVVGFKNLEVINFRPVVSVLVVSSLHISERNLLGLKPYLAFIPQFLAILEETKPLFPYLAFVYWKRSHSKGPSLKFVYPFSFNSMLQQSASAYCIDNVILRNHLSPCQHHAGIQCEPVSKFVFFMIQIPQT